jgi:hypothetical protein
VGSFRITFRTVIARRWTAGSPTTRNQVRSLSPALHIRPASRVPPSTPVSSTPNPHDPSRIFTCRSYSLYKKPILSYRSLTALAEQPPAGQYPPQQDPRSSNFSSTTPSSEYALPSSARSGNFPDYINNPRQHYSPGQGPPQGGMAQPPSPSMPLHSNHANNQTPQSARSNNEVPIDPSIAASPTYPPQSHYPQYQTQPDMYGAGHPGVYGRPDWAGGQYAQPPPAMAHYGHPSSSGPPSAGLVSPVNRPPAVGPILI